MTRHARPAWCARSPCRSRWPPAPRPACTEPERRRRSGRRRAIVRSTSTDDACELSADRGAGGHRRLHGEQRRQQGHRVLPLRRGRPAHRRRGREHRARPEPRPGRRTSTPASYVTACKPGMVGEGIRGDFTVTDSGRTAAPSGRRSQQLVDAADRALRRLRARPVRRSSSPTTREFVDAVHRRRRRRRRAPLYPPARTPLGAHRDRRGVLRRPRPADGPARGRPRARPESGPAGTASRRTCGRRPTDYTAADPAAARRPTPHDLLAEHRGPARAGRRSWTSPSTRSPTAPRACSTRSPPARSPARRRSGRTPTSGTSRPTSTAPESPSRASSRCWRPRTPSSPTQLDRAVRRAAGAARPAPRRRDGLRLLRRP